MSENNTLILGYWEIRGLAQRIRMILQYCGLPYKQVKYNQTNQQHWFNVQKPQHLKINPAANLPYLIDGNRIIAESDAIIIYIIHKADKTQLLGQSPQQLVLTATTMGIFRDYHKKYISLVYGSKQQFEKKQDKIKQWQTELTKLNSLLQGKQYFAGHLTWVDFIVSQNIQAVSLLDNKILEAYPNLSNHWKRIWDLPELKKYHESERWHQRPVNYPNDAAWY